MNFDWKFHLAAFWAGLKALVPFVVISLVSFGLSTFYPKVIEVGMVGVLAVLAIWAIGINKVG